MKLFAIIVAAGSGKRMGSAIPKQFMLLHQKPLYTYATQTFMDTFPEIEIILVLPKNYRYTESDITRHFEKNISMRILEGGDTRFESVKIGLSQISGQGIVFIHDAVRPFINAALLRNLLIETEQNGNAIPCIDVRESLRHVDENANRAVDRTQYKCIQTPQVFKTELIQNAYQTDYADTFTDDAAVLEATGAKINLIPGLIENIKITNSIDFFFAENLIPIWHPNQNEIPTGFEVG